MEAIFGEELKGRDDMNANIDEIWVNGVQA